MRWFSAYPFALAIIFPSLVLAQGGLGAACASTDSSSTGSTPTCDSGYCRSNGCSDPSTISGLGDPCTNDNQCVDAETFNDTPAYCAGVAGEQTTCGGASAFCYSAQGSSTGPSATCASNVCKANQCAAANGGLPGESCSSDPECSGYARCVDGTCNDVGLPCTAEDGSSTGTIDFQTCSTGFCRQGGCASFPGSYLGEACSVDEACIGSETFSETPAYCAGVAGEQTTCGGASAFCYTAQGGSTGPSATCDSGICKANQCAAADGAGPGESCSSDSACTGYARCLDGTCNDVGFPCTATDGSGTGSTDTQTCSTGFCRQGGCASFPASDLGEPCSVSEACVGAETFSDTPAYCASVAGEQATCGGASAFCYTAQGSSTGPSATCASDICKANQCAAVTGPGPGESCSSDPECTGYARCLDGTCNDVGFPCTATDGSGTGSTDTQTCSTGFCRQGGCASFPASDLGEACSVDASCVGAETFSDTPAYCAGSAGVPTTCGGGSAFCYTLQGGSSGFSPTCASGQCLANQCKRVDPVAPGEACQGNYDCGGGITCVNGFCTGGEDTCAADDNNGQAIGPSDDCTSDFCRAGQCSNVPVAVLGDICDEDRDCSGFEDNANFYRSLLNCGQAGSGTRRCGSGGAACVALDGGPSGSTSALCISGQCFEYACTDSTVTNGLRKRGDVPVQHVIQKRLCPKGFEPCPLYPRGYECIDVMNDIESCGGCVGRGMPGIDCSADVHAAAVSCVSGKCVISACEMGYAVATENNTCIAE